MSRHRVNRPAVVLAVLWLALLALLALGACLE
jgi:hypothetical protein